MTAAEVLAAALIDLDFVDLDRSTDGGLGPDVLADADHLLAHLRAAGYVVAEGHPLTVTSMEVGCHYDPRAVLELAEPDHLATGRGPDRLTRATAATLTAPTFTAVRDLHLGDTVLIGWQAVPDPPADPADG